MAMTLDQASEVAQIMCEFWPAPELSDNALALLEMGVADTGLEQEQALGAIRALMQQDHAFRPTLAALRLAAKPNVPPYFQPFAELEAAPVASIGTVKTHLAQARGLLGADPEATRAAKAERDKTRSGYVIGPADRYANWRASMKELTKGAPE